MAKKNKRIDNFLDDKYKISKKLKGKEEGSIDEVLDSLKRDIYTNRFLLIGKLFDASIFLSNYPGLDGDVESYLKEFKEKFGSIYTVMGRLYDMMNLGYGMHNNKDDLEVRKEEGDNGNSYHIINRRIDYNTYFI